MLNNGFKQIGTEIKYVRYAEIYAQDGHNERYSQDKKIDRDKDHVSEVWKMTPLQCIPHYDAEK